MKLKINCIDYFYCVFYHVDTSDVAHSRTCLAAAIPTCNLIGNTCYPMDCFFFLSSEEMRRTRQDDKEKSEKPGARSDHLFP